jgi:L-iditol 2-dehydrogenase
MTGLGKIAIEERPMPTPGPRQAVVRIEAVGVCGSDTAYFKIGQIGDYVVEGPLILGHEVSGQVESVGSDVTNVKPGERVAIEPGTPCRDCVECFAGRYHLCPKLEFLATPPYDGALLQYMLIDSRNLFPMPDDMSYEQGALLEPLSVGIWACHRANLNPGEQVLVTGAGPVGLVSAAAARALGAGSVTVTDVSDFRLDLAKSMGFATEKSQSPSEQTFDVLIECSGAPGVLAEGLRRLRPAGRAAMVGMSKEKAIALPLAQLNPQELTISLVNRYAHTWPIAIELVSSGRVDVNPLITHHFRLDQTEDALTLGSRVPDSVKAIIHPQQ